MIRGTSEYQMAKTQRMADQLLEHARTTPNAKILIVYAGRQPAPLLISVARQIRKEYPKATVGFRPTCAKNSP